MEGQVGRIGPEQRFVWHQQVPAGMWADCRRERPGVGHDHPIVILDNEMACPEGPRRVFFERQVVVDRQRPAGIARADGDHFEMRMHQPDIGLVHPHLEVVAIRPRDAGGPLAIDNYLALEEHAARAFRAGHFIIEDDYRVIMPDAGALAPAIRPHASGHLLVPDEPLFRPNPAHLAFHRRMVLGR